MSDGNVARAGAPTYEDDGPAIPDYLEKTYWWAYVRWWAVRTFEREWLVNLILWGYYRILRDATLAAMGEKLPGRTIKISCCYGQLEPHLAARVEAGGGTLELIDVAPEQLKNARRKLAPWIEKGIVHLARRDARDLGFADAAFDRAMLFFLPHEQPDDVRRATFAEAIRVLKPGGDLFVTEFAPPSKWHPLKYLWLPFLRFLEPYAPPIWRESLALWVPDGAKIAETRRFFAGFYQVTRVRKEG